MDKATRLRQARIAAGFPSAAAAAERFGWKAAAYRHHENGTTGFLPDRALEYAQAYGVPVDWLLYARGPEPAGESRPLAVKRRVPIVGEVAAGVWREVPQFDDLQFEEVGETLPVDVEGYERAQLFALRVAGPSMNLVYPEGRYVIAAHPAEAGMRNGDYVVVQRSRAGLIETTLKELVVDGDRLSLWPRSSDPAFQKPIPLTNDPNDQDAPQVIGIVVADYARRVRPPG